MKIKNNIFSVINRDGEIISAKKEFQSRHLDALHELAKELNISELNNNEAEMVKIFAQHCHVAIMNYGIQNGKQSGLIILPKQITQKQYETLLDIKEELTSEYEYIRSYAIPNGPLAYKRDLKVMNYEDKISNLNLSDVESLYREVELQKENLDKDLENEDIKNR